MAAGGAIPRPKVHALVSNRSSYVLFKFCGQTKETPIVLGFDRLRENSGRFVAKGRFVTGMTLSPEWDCPWPLSSKVLVPSGHEFHNRMGSPPHNDQPVDGWHLLVGRNLPIIPFLRKSTTKAGKILKAIFS